MTSEAQKGYKTENKILAKEIETARITAGAIFEKYANNKEYDRAVLYQVIRDTLEQYRRALEGLDML